jgi:metal-dependent hydrolase (beta-lactamase superfamily II)
LIPQEYGGPGLGIMEGALILEAINHSGGNAGACHAQMYIMGTVLRHGSEAQKKSYLPKIATGELRLQAFGVTEPNAGSDTTKLQTTAVKKGDRYIVNGQKMFISRVLQSDLMLLLARTTPVDQVKKKTDGLSVFLIDIRPLKGKGSRSRPLRMMMNHSTNALFFDNMEIPAESLIGQEGRGFSYILDGMNAERILVASDSLGDARWFIDKAVAYASQRVIFGKPIGANQACSSPSPRPTWRSRPPTSCGPRRPRCSTPASPAGPRPTWPSTWRPKRPSRRATRAWTATAAMASPRSTTSSASSARRACTGPRPSTTTSWPLTWASTFSACRAPIDDMTLEAVDRISVTTVVDNAVDNLRADEKVARRWSHARARGCRPCRAEHGLAHWVEVTRGRETSRIGVRLGPHRRLVPAQSPRARARPRGPGRARPVPRTSGSLGRAAGFLRDSRRLMKRAMPFYAGSDHFLPRYSERAGDRVYIGRLDRAELARQDLDVRLVAKPTVLPEGVMLSGEMHETVPGETIPASLRVERDGEVVQDTFIGEQTLIAHVRGRGLVVVTSCSHRGIVGICRHAARVSGVPRIHAVMGGFHLSGLGEERVGFVVDEFRRLGLQWLVPQHCTGMEACIAIGRQLPSEMVVPSVGSTFTFEA